MSRTNSESLEKLVDVSKKYGVFCIIRHAERENILRPEDASKALLTEKGKEDAMALGRELSDIERIDFYHSPVERCIETVDYLARGYRGYYELKGSSAYSGCPYILDDKKFNELIFEKTGPVFLRDWFSRKLPNSIIKPWDEAFNMMIHGLKSINLGKKGIVDVHITHDINIALFLNTLFGSSWIDQQAWPDYLEMIIVYYDEKDMWIYGRGVTKKID